MRRFLVLVAVVATVLAAVDVSQARAGLLAPLGVCANPSVGAPVAKQRWALRCYHNYARQKAGLSRLRYSWRLHRAAQIKALRIVRCDRFEHTPCGFSFESLFRQVGYGEGRWSVGENIAWGSRWTVRHTFRAWLASPGHRANILTRRWRQIGAARAFWYGNVRVWVVEFGRR